LEPYPGFSTRAYLTICASLFLFFKTRVHPGHRYCMGLI
jgi:hypothetical protein